MNEERRRRKKEAKKGRKVKTKADAQLVAKGAGEHAADAG